MQLAEGQYLTHHISLCRKIMPSSLPPHTHTWPHTHMALSQVSLEWWSLVSQSSYDICLLIAPSTNTSPVYFLALLHKGMFSLSHSLCHTMPIISPMPMVWWPSVLQILPGYKALSFSIATLSPSLRRMPDAVLTLERYLWKEGKKLRREEVKKEKKKGGRKGERREAQSNSDLL